MIVSVVNHFRTDLHFGLPDEIPLHTIRDRLQALSDTLYWSDNTPLVACYRTWPYKQVWLFTLFQDISTEHLQWMWHADRGRLFLRTLRPVPLSYVETYLSKSCLVSRSLCFERHSVLLFYFVSLWLCMIALYFQLDIYFKYPVISPYCTQINIRTLDFLTLPLSLLSLPCTSFSYAH